MKYLDRSRWRFDNENKKDIYKSYSLGRQKMKAGETKELREEYQQILKKLEKKEILN